MTTYQRSIVASLVIAMVASATGAIASARQLQEPPQNMGSENQTGDLSATAGQPDGNPPAAAASDDKPTRIDPFWKDVPVTQKLAKPGGYGTPPTGPGYYSAQDWWRGNCRESPPNYPYAPFGLMPLSFFDVNWKFLDDPEKQWGLSDGWKRQPLGCNWLVTAGGSEWWRYMHESNSRLTGADQDYHLLRTRAYLDLSYLDSARIFVEFIDAHRFGGDLAPLRTDVNRSDLLNAFVDWQFASVDGQPWWVRMGRQELTFGSQRLVTGLEWANTRRTFEGVRVFRRGDHGDFDLWWSQPVVVDDSSFDQVDGNQHFVGAWLTKRPCDNQTLDFYYLYLGNTDPVLTLDREVDAVHTHTWGLRSLGNRGCFHHDYELMGQLGRHGDQDIVAGAATVGHGVHLPHLPGGPQFWLYYDWASGDDDPYAGNYHTFNHLFPFGHYYMGLIDATARQNIHDVNLQCVFYPAPWITVISQYHHLALDASRDALYAPSGSVSRVDGSGNSGRHLGEELDLLCNLHMGPHSDVMIGYSHLCAGRFLRSTGPGESPDLFYLQYGWRW